MKGLLQLLAGGATVVVLAALLSRDPAPPPTATAAPTPAWAPPAGYTIAPGEPTVGWRWMDGKEFDCTYSRGSCFGVEAVARDGCPSSLYVELSLQDASGTAIGMTNDTVGSVSPGQHAKLIFDTFEEAVRKARIAEVSCY